MGTWANNLGSDSMKPTQINAKGLTHLFYNWAQLDSRGSFVLENGHDEEIPDFIAHKTSSTQVWIAIRPDDPVNGTVSAWSVAFLLK